MELKFYAIKKNLKRGIKKMVNQKTDLGVMLRFSTDKMWIHFMESMCSDCIKSLNSCNDRQAHICFDQWLYPDGY